MESGTRQPAGDLTGEILEEASRHQFYQLVERIHRLNQDDLEQPLDIQPCRELIRYETDPSLGFPKADVCQAGVEQRCEMERYFIQIAFMGIHGGSSPLPHHYLEKLAYEGYQQIGIRVPFFNFFNHRLITLLHRAWRKYRYYIRFSPEAKDRFSQDIFSLVGLNDVDLRGENPIPWSRLLTYVGMVATRSRAPSMVAGIIAHCFDLERVEIKEWDKRYVEVSVAQQNRLGSCNVMLSESFIVGERVLSISSKFVISILGLNRERFGEFLPIGHSYRPLNSLVEFLLRDQLSYDLELGLLQEEVPPFRLSQQDSPRLGWTSFLGKTSLQRESAIRIGVRK